MKSDYMFLLCIMTAGLVFTVVCHRGSIPNACCFDFYSRRVKKDLVRSYFVTDKRCTKPGVILVTVKSTRICVNPAASWVRKILKTLDEKYF